MYWVHFGHDSVPIDPKFMAMALSRQNCALDDPVTFASHNLPGSHFTPNHDDREGGTFVQVCFPVAIEMRCQLDIAAYIASLSLDPSMRHPAVTFQSAFLLPPFP
jgi:hypothetical protein